MEKFVPAVLLFYHHTAVVNAPTIMEHVNSFQKYSSFKVISLNVAYAFPRELKSFRFTAIVLHYSLFGTFPFQINNRLLKYIKYSRSIKIAFFQDEMQYCQQRFDFINKLKIDIIFSLLNTKYFEEVYIKNSSVKYVKPTLTGYVCDDLILNSKKYFVPIKDRAVDVGYRARDLSFHFGRGAREKKEIAENFVMFADHSNLKLDISTRECDRIYGEGWYHFLANCKFMLGVMAGTSIFDLSGNIKSEVDSYLLKYPSASFEDVENSILFPYEENINYRTISPRIFECAAFHTCMILYRDDYQGILTAGKHYIALEKDFSNIDSVFQQINNDELVELITRNAYKDLILSENWHYKMFMKEFDETLVALGCSPECSLVKIDDVNSAIFKDAWFRNSIVLLKSLRSRPFPGRDIIKSLAYKLGVKQE